MSSEFLEVALKHTPGPWYFGETKIKEFNDTKTIGVAPIGEPTTEPVNMICLIAPTVNFNEQDRANANLICAAPEMFRVLEILKHELERNRCAKKAMLVLINSVLSSAKGK